MIYVLLSSKEKKMIYAFKILYIIHELILWVQELRTTGLTQVLMELVRLVGPLQLIWKRWMVKVNDSSQDGVV